MTLHPIFSTFINKEYKYSYSAGPDKVRSLEDVEHIGINCVSLAHLVLERMYGVNFDNEYKCIEMFYDQKYLRLIGTDEQILTGDLFFFGREGLDETFSNFKPIYSNEGHILNGNEFPGLHIGIFTGEVDPTGQPIIMHASYIEKKVTVWQLNAFAEYQKYKTIYAIKRFIT